MEQLSRNLSFSQALEISRQYLLLQNDNLQKTSPRAPDEKSMWELSEGMCSHETSVTLVCATTVSFLNMKYECQWTLKLSCKIAVWRMIMYRGGGRGLGGVDSVVKFSDCRWMLGRNKRVIFLWFISDSLNCFLNEEFSFLSYIGFVNDTTNPLFHHAFLIANKMALALTGTLFFEPH